MSRLVFNGAVARVATILVDVVDTIGHSLDVTDSLCHRLMLRRY